ncbi:MAG: TetR/AcrR family transcriptional regulator [Bacteroidales bacterium]|jgi:TetR/AcrR family transcriptional regulator|nr:TetR/AcrR family transcriptional regulator [Bacteroidales bacterium]
MDSRTEAEQQIIDAATKVFIAKGFKAATMKDIATEANTALSMTNYYFRSKKQLFDLIFDRVFDAMYGQLKTIDFSKSLFEIIENFVEVYSASLAKIPAIPNFIFAELSHNPERMVLKVKERQDLNRMIDTIQKKFDQEYQNGVIKKVDPFTIIINIEALCAFPFLAHPLIECVTTTVGFKCDDILKEQNRNIARFVIDAIKA